MGNKYRYGSLKLLGKCASQDICWCTVSRIRTSCAAREKVRAVQVCAAMGTHHCFVCCFVLRCAGRGGCKYCRVSERGGLRVLEGVSCTTARSRGAARPLLCLQQWLCKYSRAPERGGLFGRRGGVCPCTSVLLCAHSRAASTAAPLRGSVYVVGGRGASLCTMARRERRRSPLQR